MFVLVEQLAVVLHQQGIHSTSRIAFATPRGAPAVVGFLAASSVGTCCPLDGKLEQSEFSEAFAALALDILLSLDDDPPGGPQNPRLQATHASGLRPLAPGSEPQR